MRRSFRKSSKTDLQMIRIFLVVLETESEL